MSTITTNLKVIAFNRCWECGCCRIVGEIHNGHITRMSKPEWIKAQKAFLESWKTMFANNTQILSSAGSSWETTFEKLGYKASIISENYDGC